MRCRSDLNQSAIVRSLRKLGASVSVVSSAAHGYDLVIGYRGRNFIAEVKQPGRKDDLTPNERAMIETWRGSYLLIDGVEDFIEQIEKLC